MRASVYACRYECGVSPYRVLRDLCWVIVMGGGVHTWGFLYEVGRRFGRGVVDHAMDEWGDA